MESKYFENEGPFFRSRDLPNMAWIDDVWTPDGWKPYRGDKGARSFTCAEIKKIELPPEAREPLLHRFSEVAETGWSAVRGFVGREAVC